MVVKLVNVPEDHEAAEEEGILLLVGAGGAGRGGSRARAQSGRARPSDARPQRLPGLRGLLHSPGALHPPPPAPPSPAPPDLF
jgi:hypothetical protein